MLTCECCGQVLPDQFEVVAARAGLSRMQGRMFLAIAAGKGTVVPWERIASGMYSDDIDGGPLNLQNTMHATRCHANARLRKVGVRHLNRVGRWVPGRGYRAGAGRPSIIGNGPTNVRVCHSGPQSW